MLGATEIGSLVCSSVAAETNTGNDTIQKSQDHASENPAIEQFASSHQAGTMNECFPSLSSPEVLVFDFDGVIANTEPLYWRAWCELLQPYNVAFAWADYCRIGRGIRDEKMLASLAEIGPVIPA